ncbi:MAG: acetamidase/formamidase family protein [Actinomycetota bacterium]|nr:acetamidase/formamidase family protein [Actinomycetota bacterium]
MTSHKLAASPDTCFWGYYDASQPTVLSVESGDVVEIEAVTHHSGDAPDLLMDDGIRAIWDGIPEADRAPGVHIMTGPIEVVGAQPGDTLLVEILEMAPRLKYGSNCAANWGLLYDTFGKERITIYELADAVVGEADGFGPVARPMFGFDFTARQLYDVPGVVTEPDDDARQPFGRPVAIPVRPHFGVIGVAPETTERVNSIPPGVFGGNVDNWRFGPGASIYYPVFHEGARFFVGDPHFAQGDGEICGTAIEASLNARVRLSVVRDVKVAAPLLDTGSHLFTHGFGEDLDVAMRMAAEQMLALLQERYGLTADEAYSVASVGIDLGVTQVVDGTLGCHASVAKALFD